MTPTALLDTLHSPAELRQLAREQLPQLAEELRTFLVESVSRTGGHLSSNLGTVELSIALHYVFDTPHDPIVWDVGHQSYSHKILTGRREAMSTLRQYGGLSGFPRRDESEYDAFGTAHSSTSIAAALGMAIAARDQGRSQQSIAVIGDGALSAGMAFEALNHAGDLHDIDLIVILNDNEMSISPPVGAISRILSRMLSGATWHAARRVGGKMLDMLPPARDIARRVEEHVKGLVTPGTLFEEFGFDYYGPIDGHDLDTLVPVLQNLRKIKGPRFLHIVTRKGQGYKLAEADPILYHGVSRFDHTTGIAPAQPSSASPTPPACAKIFGDWLCEMAAQEERLVAITPAMREGSGMVRFAETFPERYHDVGIAEQHALTLAAGLACGGLKPVVAIYSTFLQRAYDQFVHDIALQNLPVLLAIDRAGLVGADGATHHGAFDLAFLTCIPNLTFFCPATADECRAMLTAAFQHDGPTAVRYPRGSLRTPAIIADQAMPPIEIGKAHVLRQGKRIAIAAFGTLVAPAAQAAQALDATIVNMRFAKPLDTDCLRALAAAHELIVVVEEGSVIGGVGGEIARFLDTLPRAPRLLRLGLPDRFIDHGDQSRLLAYCGLDAHGIQRSIEEHLKVLDAAR